MSAAARGTADIARHHRDRGARDSAARRRQQMLEWHTEHGQNVSKTCRHFGISRPTFYRWQRRYDPHRPDSLADRSCRPARTRARTWPDGAVGAVQTLRDEYPRWGKDKLAVLRARQGVRLSVSMGGRILTHLRDVGTLVEPLRRISARKRQRVHRPHATRTPTEYTPTAPGDLVQLDTLDVRPEPGVVLKQCTARDVVSRWDVLTLVTNATAAATRALDAIQARMPFDKEVYLSHR